jgi:hypothetical protein
MGFFSFLGEPTADMSDSLEKGHYSQAKAEPAANDTRRSSVPSKVLTPAQKMARTK